MQKTIKKGFPLLWGLVIILCLQGCSHTTRYPKSKPTVITLRFTYGEKHTPLSNESDLASVTQIISFTTCESLFPVYGGGSYNCDSDSEHLNFDAPIKLDANGEVKVEINSSGPIGTYPTTRCFGGTTYVFDSGKFHNGPFSNGHVVEINYNAMSITGAKCSRSETTPEPKWFDSNQARPTLG